MPLDFSEIRTRYDRDGFVCPIDVMSAGEAAGFRRELEDAEAKYRDQKEFRQAVRRYPNLVLPFVDAITRRPEITDPVAELLGPNLLVLDAPFFIKEPNTTNYVSWHQDLHYWGLETDDEVTAWVALSPATRASGCMRFVAGSQSQKVDHTDTFDDNNLLSRGQEIAVEVDEADATDAELQPGQMSLHHGRVFHASDPNTTDDRRIGIAIRFIPTNARQAAGGNMAAMLVRGVDDHRNFRVCTPPDALMSDTALAHWRDIAGARMAVMMGGTKS